MIAILSLLLLGYNVFADKEGFTTMRWAKDAGIAPTFENNDDGTVTGIYPIMEGNYEQVEAVRRRLQQMTQQEFREAVLDKHNELRSTTARGLAPCKCGSTCGDSHQGSGYHPGATNMNELFWEPSLESVAQAYADKCLFIHNKQRTEEQEDRMSQAIWDQTKAFYVGENLYVSSTGTKVWNNMFGDKDYGIEGGLYGWWIECEDYKYPEGGSCGGQVGHYTQYVDAFTRFVGCGITICPNGIATESTTYTWAEMNLVCNYQRGQYSGSPYEQAKTANDVASNCDPDRTRNLDTGLCGGPMKADYPENPQSSYNEAKTEANGWICHDGTGRGNNVGCGTTPTTTSTSTLRPSAYPTKRPTNRPIATRTPTTTTTLPPTNPPIAASQPTPKPTPQPVHVVTPRPTRRTPDPTSGRPTYATTKPPTRIPTTTARPTSNPIVPTTGSCDPSDCEYKTDIRWVTENWKYNNFATYCWNREKELLDLQARNGWSSYYSWGGSYKRGTNGWILNIYDIIDVDFTDMDCATRDSFNTLIQSDDFKNDLKDLVLQDMIEEHGTGCGYVESVTVTVSCTGSDAAAFGAIDEDGNVELPFSTWNLNSYDFSDWFVLLFVLFTGCACCFGCGWAMHRRRVFKAMDDASISDFGATHETPIVSMDGNASSNIMVSADNGTDYGNSGGYVGNSNEPEIEIGVSVNSNHTGIMDEDYE